MITKELSPELLLAESFFDPQAASVPTKSAALMLSAKNFKPRLFRLHLPFFDQIFPGMTDGADLLILAFQVFPAMSAAVLHSAAILHKLYYNTFQIEMQGQRCIKFAAKI